MNNNITTPNEALKTDPRAYAKDLWETIRFSFTELLIINILWFILTLPILTAPAAFAGMYYATQALAKKESVSWRTFFEGFKAYIWPGYRWGLLNLAVIGILGFNFLYIGVFMPDYAGILKGVYIAMFILWVPAQTYVFPFILEQEKPAVFLALRISLGLHLKYPGFTIAVDLLIILVCVISLWLWPLWAVFTVSFSGYMANLALHFLLQRFKNEQEAE